MKTSNHMVGVVKELRDRERDGVYLKIEKHLGKVLLGGSGPKKYQSRARFLGEHSIERFSRWCQSRG